MSAYKNKKQEKNEVASNDSIKSHYKNTGTLQLRGNRPGTVVQRELQQKANDSYQVQALRNLQLMADKRQAKKIPFQKNFQSDDKQKTGYFSLPAIQRVVNWNENEVQTKDPIDVVMSFADWGFTNFIINDSENKAAPMRTPEFSFEKTNFGLTKVGVVKEAVNNLGTRMEIPIAPPWVRHVPKKRIGGIFYSEAAKYFKVDLESYMKGDGDTELKVKGVPGDGIMVTHTRDHEQHHVDDDRDARQQIIDPWDNALNNMIQTRETFLGLSPVHALTRLYNSAGGTPAEIGDRYFNKVKQLGIQYHQTDEGSKPPLAGVNTSEDQSTIEILYKPH